jgi:hypothetical protein
MRGLAECSGKYDQVLDALKAAQAEPDSPLLMAHAKALLYIAQRGETTDRRQHLKTAGSS